MAKITALITARGGSQGVPGKNIRSVGGKPLIAWSIEAARQSRSVSRVIVSTDDERIAAVAWYWRAEVPFRRPAHLAQADSPHVDVVLHALDWLEEAGDTPDYLLLLQPTSPLRTADDIDQAVDIALEHDADSLVSVCPARQHPWLVKRLTPDGTLADFVRGDLHYQRRQDLPPAYVLNGAIYLIKPKVLRRHRSLLPEGTRAYIMPIERSVEVDDWHDLHLVRRIMEGGEWQGRVSTSPDASSDAIIPVSSLRKPA